MKPLTIKRKKYGVNIQEIYFSPECSGQIDCDLKINFCVDNQGKNTKEVLTSVIDLRQEPAKILEKFRAGHRSGIQANVASKELVYRFVAKPCSEDIKVFSKYYNIFANQKNLPSCNEDKLRFFAGQDALVLTTVRHANTEDLLCLHAFISDGERTRLLYSVSNFRLHAEDAKQRTTISKIHKSLHWFEINQFKRLNYKIYDLGGIATEDDPDLKNVNQFKRGFGGEERKEYFNFTPKNLKGWLAMRYLMKKL